MALRQANSAGSMFSWRNLSCQIKNPRKIFSHTLMTLVGTVIIRLVALEICQGWHKGEDEGVKGSQPKMHKIIQWIKMRICSKCKNHCCLKMTVMHTSAMKTPTGPALSGDFYISKHCSLHCSDNSCITSKQIFE